jgi:hypothetical protein
VRVGPLSIDREHAIVIGFSVLNAGAGLLANRLLTQVVSPEPLGRLYLYMNLATWITLPTAGLYTYASRHWSVAQARGVTRRYTRRLLSYAGAQVAFALVATLAMSPIRALGLGSLRVAGLLWLVSTGIAVSQLFDWVATIERRRVLAGVLNLLGSPVRQVSLALAGIFSFFSADAALRLLGIQAGYSTLYAVLTVGSFFFVARNRLRSPSAQVAAPMTLGDVGRFALPYLATAAVGQLCRSAERWGLASQSTAQTAIFVQSVGLSSAMVGAASSHLSIYFSAIIYSAAADSPRPLIAAAAPIRHYMQWTLLLLGILATVVAFGAGTLTPIFFGPKYSAVTPLLPWTTLGACLFGFGQALHIYGLTARRTVGPNVAAIVAQLLYSSSLLLYHPASDMALQYARLYACGNGLYVLILVSWVVRLFRRQAKGSEEVGPAPSQPVVADSN